MKTNFNFFNELAISAASNFSRDDLAILSKSFKLALGANSEARDFKDAVKCSNGPSGSQIVHMVASHEDLDVESRTKCRSWKRMPLAAHISSTMLQTRAFLLCLTCSLRVLTT